jgi:predicted ATP-dependent serine protease
VTRDRVLLERDDAMSVLVDSLGEIERSVAGRAVFIGGEAGVGKTTEC